MKKLIPFALSVAMAGFFTGCGSDSDDVSPETGTVTGTITPANSASKVYLIAGTDTIKSDPTATGTYEIKEVKTGSYTLAFKATDAFDAPAPSTVEVRKGQTTTVPAVTFTALPANGTMSVVINGVLQTGTVTYFAGNGYPILFYTNGFPNNWKDGYDIRWEMPRITGVGTYDTSKRDANGGEVEFTVSNQGNVWWANYSMGSASVNVTSFNPTTKRISGTFTFRAWNSDDPDKNGTNGVFKNIRVFQ